MIAEIVIEVGTVTFRLALPLTEEKVAEVRAELATYVSAVYDNAVDDLRAEIAKREISAANAQSETRAPRKRVRPNRARSAKKAR